MTGSSMLPLHRARRARGKRGKERRGCSCKPWKLKRNPLLYLSTPQCVCVCRCVFRGGWGRLPTCWPRSSTPGRPPRRSPRSSPGCARGIALALLMRTRGTTTRPRHAHAMGNTRTRRCVQLSSVTPQTAVSTSSSRIMIKCVTRCYLHGRDSPSYKRVAQVGAAWPPSTLEPALTCRHVVVGGVRHVRRGGEVRGLRARAFAGARYPQRLVAVDHTR